MSSIHRTTAITSLLAALFLTGSLVGCNTIEGAGEDIGAAGEAIEEGAEN